MISSLFCACGLCWVRQDEVDELIADKDEELGGDDEGVGGGHMPYRHLMRERDERTEEELAKYLEERYK